MTKYIAFLSVLALASTGFSAGNVLVCSDSKDITVNVEMNGSQVKSFVIEGFQPALGKFTQADMISYDTNEIASKRYEKKSTSEGVAVTEVARFGIQQIGSVKTAYLAYAPGAGATELETLLICQ